MIAALYVQRGGVYWGIPGVDAWDEARDARLYAGPWPAVAHPPCARWGRFALGGPNWRGPKKVVGDDGGCFEAALASVRKYGGVLEHPAHSKAWDHFGLAKPPRTGGWFEAGDGGWTCCVDQGKYGHPAGKATWLYAVADWLPELNWGKLEVAIPEDLFPMTYAEARRWKHRGLTSKLSKRERAATPAPFRDLLLSIARTARRQQEAA